tara:strand:- start:28 stop:171 length:144 start_codon:yes stop_codon:yes gene_type:complete
MPIIRVREWSVLEIKSEPEIARKGGFPGFRNAAFGIFPVWSKKMTFL